MEDISTNSRDDSENVYEDDSIQFELNDADRWNMFESEAINANAPDADDGSKNTGEDGDCSKCTDEDDDDIDYLFENIFPDNSDSESISDTKCNTHENAGKNVINSNSSVSPISIRSRPQAEENAHYITKVTYSSLENENKNHWNSKQYSDSSSPHVEESTQDIDELTCNSFENYAKNDMNNKRISTSINQTSYVEESAPKVESDINTLDRENKKKLDVSNEEWHESINRIKEEDVGIMDIIGGTLGDGKRALEDPKDDSSPTKKINTDRVRMSPSRTNVSVLSKEELLYLYTETCYNLDKVIEENKKTMRRYHRALTQLLETNERLLQRILRSENGSEILLVRNPPEE